MDRPHPIKGIIGTRLCVIRLHGVRSLVLQPGWQLRRPVHYAST
jgi:hypothetical protein